VYERNRSLFLMQSCLLGISYSIIWPTLYKYVTKEFTDVSLTWQKILYGTTFIAYPVASMLAAHVVQRMTSLNTRMLFVLLNVAEIVGNLMYAINFHPACLFFGRFIAGIGDAFFVVIMQDVRIIRNYKGGSVAAQCLGSFILGLGLAQLINIICIYIPFKIGDWSLQVWNFPALLAAVLFCLLGIVLMLTLDISHDDNTSDRRQQQANGNNDNDNDNDNNEIPDTSVGFSSVFVCVFSFVHTFIVSMLEILIPMFIYSTLKEDVFEAVLLYAILGLFYAMLLLATMSITSPLMLEVSLLVSVLFKLLALLCVVLLSALHMSTINAMVSLVGIMVAVAFMWSNEDVMYTNIILTLVPYPRRQYTSGLRKTTSKFSFVVSGVAVPLMFGEVGLLYVSLGLLVAVGLLFGMFITLRMFGRAINKL